MNNHSSARGRLGRAAAAVVTAAALIGGALVATPAAAAGTDLTLISTAGTTWKYRADNTDPAGVSTAVGYDKNSWTGTAFNDSTWSVGKSTFGSKNGSAVGVTGRNPVTTLLPLYIGGVKANGDIPEYFLRTAVTVTADQLARMNALTATIDYDDAVAVFVNGTPVKYLDVYNTQANLTYAADYTALDAPTVSTFTIDPSLLHAGSNTIAVGLYQHDSASSDIYLDFTSLVASETPTAPQISDVVLNMGADQSQRNVAWYTTSTLAETAQVAKASDVVGGAFPTTATSFTAYEHGTATDGQTYQHAAMSGLEPNTAYVYRVGSVNAWSPTYSFSTHAFSGDYDFLYFGDAQIGASGNTTNDTAGWVDTLNAATTRFPTSEFLFSGGDQVDSAADESQYAGFLSPSQLRSLPLATLDGNHDVGSKAYNQHYAMPNFDAAHGAASSSTASGGDYWFLYNDVLYMSLDSNQSTTADIASHQQFLQQVVAAHGAAAKWRVVAFHHSVYSVATHVDDSDVARLRAALPTILSDLDIDLVFMGHDHSYTRSYLINDGVVAENTAAGAQATVTAKPGDVLYVTGNSSSGSKYYEPKTREFPYAAVINQNHTPNFSHVEVTDHSITVATYESTTGTKVDSVTLKRVDVTAPALTVPAGGSVAVDSAFDAMTGVTATDGVDGDLTGAVTVAGSVDTTRHGTYTLTYTVTDAAGNTATATRVVTVEIGTNANVVAPVVSGSATVGQVVGVSTGSWSVAPTSVAYQWMRDGAAIPGATAPAYLATAADAGTALSVRVTAVRAEYADAAAIVTVGVVAKATLTAHAPTVSGHVRVASKVTVSAGTWTSGASLSYRWTAAGRTVSTARSFTIPASLAGQRLSVTVTGEKAGYTTVSTSSRATVVARGVLSSSRPSITGTTKVGKTVRASVHGWTSGTRFSYRWYANGRAIRGATSSTLRLTSAYRGDRLTVAVTGSKTGYATVSLPSSAKRVSR